MKKEILRPFFTFFGGKWRVAKRYPKPEFDTIVEPFAGSAGYSVRHPEKRIILVERDPLIAETWRYLLRVKPDEILSLPDIQIEQSVDDLLVCPEARLLIGWWLNGGSSTPKKRPSRWMKQKPEHGGLGWKNKGGQLCWGPGVRERIAKQLPAISHWKIIEGDYHNAPDIKATWFIDPPYQLAGKYYRFSSKKIDYPSLGDWCKNRSGQVVVCENLGANWLPFWPWMDIKSSGLTADRVGISKEVIWTNDDQEITRIVQESFA